MKDHKAPLDLESVQQHIQRLEQELAAYKALEQSLVAIRNREYTQSLKGRFRDMRPYDAICTFLKLQGKPQTRFEIIRAVIEGEALLGANKQKSVNQSISTNARQGKLREKNGLVGLTSWADEKFMVDR